MAHQLHGCTVGPWLHRQHDTVLSAGIISTKARANATEVPLHRNDATPRQEHGSRDKVDLANRSYP